MTILITQFTLAISYLRWDSIHPHFCTYETFIGNFDMNINDEIKIFSIICLSMVEFSLIELEVTPPQQGFPLESTQSISSPLVGPNPFQGEGVVATPCGCSCSWTNHL